jgi:hypothetical protein
VKLALIMTVILRVCVCVCVFFFSGNVSRAVDTYGPSVFRIVTIVKIMMGIIIKTFFFLTVIM